MYWTSATRNTSEAENNIKINLWATGYVNRKLTELTHSRVQLLGSGFSGV